MRKATLQLTNYLLSTGRFQNGYKDGADDVENDPKPRRPSKTGTDANIQKFMEMVWSDCRIRMMAEQLRLNRESVKTILLDDWGT